MACLFVDVVGDTQKVKFPGWGLASAWSVSFFIHNFIITSVFFFIHNYYYSKTCVKRPLKNTQNKDLN